MLLIITPSKFILNLERLKIHKEQTGMSTAIITLEDIYKKYSQGDEAEKVKRCIADFEKKGFLFFFLVGDADTFPVRFTKTDRNVPETHNTAFYPTDLYYACLYRQDGSFDDWNANTNQYYGELQGHPPNTGIINVDQVNMIPTVAVGRAPVSTEQELERYINKIIRYEMQAFNAKWTKNALLMATHDWYSSACKAQEDIAKNYLKAYSSVLLFSEGSPCSGAGKLTSSAVTSWFNKGVGVVAYIGHGNSSGLGIPEDFWGIDNISQLKNTKLPIMIVNGCETALFTGMLPPYGKYIDINNAKHVGTTAGEIFTSPPPQPHCLQTWYDPDSDLATQLTVGTDAGVIAYIGGVTGMQSYTTLVYFLKGLPFCKTLGDAWKWMVQHYYQDEKIPSNLSKPDWHAVAANIQGWIVMLFGDPSLRIGGVKYQPSKLKAEMYEALLGRRI